MVTGGGVPNILHQVSVPVMDNLSCQDMFNESGHKKTIRDSFLCAGYKEGKKDSCEVMLQFNLNCKKSLVLVVGVWGPKNGPLV